ncbi:MAG TPA: tetratricopeptide repeat protein [Polyangiaceae bacterium]
MRTTFFVPFLLALAFGTGTRTARAQDDAARASAIQLFDLAAALRKEGKFAEACPKFAESQRLDPQLGTLIHLADCYEQNGQFASAYAAFRDAAELAERKNDSRLAMIQSRSAALKPRLSYLTIEVTAAARGPGLEVTRDGVSVNEVVFGTPMPIDRGEHRIVAVMPGKKAWSTSVSITSEASSARVEVPVLEPEAQAPAEPPVPPPPPPAPVAVPPEPSASRGIPAGTFVAGGVALVGLGAGVIFNVLARSSAQSAEDACDEDASDKDTCVVESKRDRDARESDLSAAETQRTVSYVGFGVAAAGAVAAVTIYLLAGSGETKSTATVVTPELAPGFARVTVSGSFW